MGAIGCGPQRIHAGDHDASATSGTSTDADTTAATDLPDPGAPLCFAAREIYEYPHQGVMTFPDTRGDGVPELWFVWAFLRSTSTYGLARTQDRRYESYAGFDERVIGWADVDGDGRDDAITCPSQGCPTAWLSTTGTPSEALVLDLDPDEGIVGWSDIDGDGFADAITARDEVLRVWRGDGSGSFVPMAQVSLSPWRSAAGLLLSRTDHRTFAIVTCTGCTAEVRLLHLDDAGVLQTLAVSEPLRSPRLLALESTPAGALRVVVEHLSPDSERLVDLLVREGDGLVPSLRIHDIETAEAGDFDGDGRLDLMWRAQGQTWVQPALGQTEEVMAVDVDLVQANAGLFWSGEPPPRVADLDGNGRDEIVQARFVGDGHLEAIELVDCP